MTYYGRRDNYYSSRFSQKSTDYSRREFDDPKSRSSNLYSTDSRIDNYSKRDHPWNQDHSGSENNKYRNTVVFASDREGDRDRQYRRSKSRSLSPPNKRFQFEHQKQEYLKNQNEDDFGLNGSDNERGDSNVFTKYQQNSWKTKGSGSSDGDKKSSILIRCLDQGVTEEQIEKVISDLAIRNGFSTPNSVQFKIFHTNSISGSLHSTDKNVNTGQYMEGYGYPYSLEKVAIVKFPSISAAGRFMATNKSRSIKIAGRDYYVEYDTLENENSANSNQESLMPAVAEIASLLNKRKMTSDWNCPSCRFLNFAKRVVCLACGISKPTEAELESQNLAIELAALNQAQMLQSNLSDVSPWVIIKNIQGDADPAKLVLTVCKAVPEAPAHLQKCVYVIDTNANTKRGFMFAQFANSTTVEKYIAKRGDKKSELVLCGTTYHRLDTVRSREKHVAEELFKKVKMANFKVNYEYDIITSETTLTSEDNTLTHLNKEYRSCKVKTTSIAAIQQYVTANETHTMSQVFFNNWISECISLPTGKPDTATFVYDPNTDYFFDHRLSLYYDAATSYYMSLTGNYYLWDDQSSSLKRVDPNANRHSPQNQNNPVSASGATGAQSSAESKKNETNSIANILASAAKVAKVSQQNVQKLTSVITEKSQVSKLAPPPTKSKSLLARKFEIGDDSEVESDMEVDGDANNNGIKMNIATSGSSVRSQSQVYPPENRKKSTNICFVCLRGFDTLDSLNFHERESKYHQALFAHYETQQN